MSASRKAGGYRAHLIALEPRMMFDAAAAVVVREAVGGDDGAHAAPAFDATPADHAPHPVQRTAAPHAYDTDGSADAIDRDTARYDDRRTIDPGTPASAAPHDIIFIDTAVADYRQLAAEWADRGEVVLIDATRDGIDQMRTALAGRSELSAIHIVSHGASGVLELGTTRIDGAAITGELAGSLAAIGRSLSADGDILIYGCDFAAGSSGAQALAAFAQVTHADVAASTDPTGYVGRGGDWDLEAHAGSVEERALSSSDWRHTLAPNNPVAIAVTANSLTVRNGAGTVVTTGTTGYGTDGRSPDVGVGATATWANATVFQGQSVDLRVTVVSISAGDAIRFNRPGIGTNPDDPTFLLRDLTAANDATVQIRWELIDHATGNPLAADVRFTIADIDGIGGNPNTRESVTASTDNLAYFTRERVTDIAFAASLSAVTASGTQNENTDPNAAVTPASAATFDWTRVSAFTLTYKLTTNSVAAQAQFYHDGDADFVYNDPVYVSIPRLDLDANDSTAPGNDALTTFTENGPRVSIVDADLLVANPEPSTGIVGATVRLTNWKPGDDLQVGALPAGISATIGAVVGGTQTITFSGNNSEADYAAAFKAVSFGNSSDTPDPAQRVIEVTFSNDTLTSATAISRINVVPVNDAPVRIGTLPARASQDAATVAYVTAGAFGDPDGDALTYSATGLPAGLTIDRVTGVISGTIDRSASQVGGGAYDVVVTARDPANASAVQTFRIDVANPPPVAANDAVTTAEDTPVTVAVFANDSDPDGDPLSIVAASAAHGSVVRNPDGTLNYTPDADFNGSDTIAYTISDGQGGTANAVVTVTVTPVNDAPTPVGTLPARTSQDAASVSFATAGGFNDRDGDSLTYSATGLPAGLTIDRVTGVISGTIDRSASQVGGGSYAITVTARDPSNAATTQTFTLTVTNPAPTARDDAVTTAEDTPVTIAVLTNDGDPDGDPLSVVAATALHGSVVRNPDGTLTYTPDADYNGSDTITYTISDGQGGMANATVAVTIAPVNDAPVANGTLPARAGLNGGVISFATAAGFADVDGDALTYTAAGLPAGLTIDPVTGVVSGRLDRSASQPNGGRYIVSVTARDPSGATATQQFAFTVTNPPPVAVDDRASTRPGMAIDIAVLANDSDPDGDPLSVIAASAAHGTVVVQPDGSIRYTANPGFSGTDTVAYTIGDGQGGTADAVVRIDVTNIPPVGTGDADVAASDGQAVSLPFADRFTNPNRDALIFGATGLPTGLAIDPATGIVSGTIDRSASQAGGGRYDAVVTADDGHGGTGTITVHFTVANPAPTARDDAATTAEDTAVTVVVLANDSDPDGDPLSVVAASAAHGQVTINPDNTLNYTPDRDYAGADTITYTISDGQGGRSSASVALTVTPVNDAPVTSGIADRIKADGTTVTIPLAPAFTDVDGGSLTYTATGLPPGLSLDPTTGILSGAITPGSAAGGPALDGRYPVSVTATDPQGATATAGFVFTISSAAPTPANDTATTREDVAVTIPVLANDTDPQGEPLTIIAATADHGTVAIVGDALTYTPAAGFSGAATIVYTVSDPAGNRATATVSVDVAPVNHAPAARPIGTQSGTDGLPAALDTASFFTDRDGDPLTYSAAGLPTGLAIDPATGRISGTVDRAASAVTGGVYRVTVTASDGALATSTSFDWTIANPAPVARDDQAATLANQAVVIPVLANDFDPDGDPLRVVGAIAAHGTVAIGGDGRLTYTPGPDFTGTDTVRYTISDGNGGTASAAVAITVDRPDRAPVIPDRDGIVRAIGGRPVAIDVLGGVTDADGDPLSISGVSAANGAVTVDPGGTLRFTPALGFVGTTTITYTITDGRGGFATGTLIVQVRAPAAADVEQLLRIGRTTFIDPPERFATIRLSDGEVRNPLALLDTVEAVRSLGATRLGGHPVLDAVNAVRTLNGTFVDPDQPIAAEVQRLDRLADRRDAGDRLFDHRWSDFDVKGLTGFSAAADRDACVMVESVVRGGAIYLEVRDIAAEGSRAPISQVSVRDASGRTPAWIKVDPRGLAIIERGADMDELHLIVRVTRADGRTSTTPIVVQGATGEVELDRHRSGPARPLAQTLVTPGAARQHAAARLTSSFE